MSITMIPDLDTRLAELLAAWNSHEDLRHDGAPIAELATSRWSLDERRTALR